MPDDLQRYVDAQAPVIDQVRGELRAGRKRTHWMWFIFPQIAGLGSSAMDQRYAIQSLEEAKAYLAHPVLGPRLRECMGLVNAVEDTRIRDLMGSPDDKKLRSSATLFSQASDDAAVFQAVIDKYFDGELDLLTLERL